MKRDYRQRPASPAARGHLVDARGGGPDDQVRTVGPPAQNIPGPRDAFTLRELGGFFVRREVRREMVRRIRPEIWAVKQSGPWLEGDVHEVESDVVHIPTVDLLAEADGVWFLCPLCWAANNGPVGTHAVLCWFVGKVPDDAEPKPGRWIPSGTGLDDLHFSGPAAASVLLTSGCGWHGFVRHGFATLR